MSDDIFDSEDDFYQKVSDTVDEILGDNVSMKEKLELYNYLLSRKRQEINKYSNLSDGSSYNNFYPSAFNQNNSSSINIYIPYQSNQFYPQQGNFYPQQSNFYPQQNVQQAPYSFGLPQNQMQMQMPPQFLQQPPFPYFNQPPIPNIEPPKKAKADSESKSKSHKKDDKKKKDKKSKDKKDKKKSKKTPKAPKVTSIKPICTCAVTEHRYIEQKWYHCRDCDLTGSSGMCEYCANHCHKGHDVYFEYVSSSCFCDCYDTGNCQLTPPSDLRCTFELTKGAALDQPMYYCDDCGINGPECICQNCAIRLHNGHELSLVDSDLARGKVCHHYRQSHP